MTLTAKKFQNRLLAWFDQHGRKSLPWQINKTPYRVWVSEIMLQQTQVSTVIPYFQHFMQKFPTIKKLADAHEDDILHLWAGLGYYSRARCLHRAAKMVCDDYQGKFPDQLETLKTLPGVGPSTAGAILSIAFNKQATILDGNVKRVLARLHAIDTPINDKKTEHLLWQYAESYTPRVRTADYTQAIMDLGATLCTRSKPNCKSCPFIKNCKAYSENLVADLPMKSQSKKIPTRKATFLILKNENKILLEKRPPLGIWGSLFCLPQLTGICDITEIKDYCQQHLKITIKDTQALKPFRHSFSHYHLEMHPIIVTVKKISTRIMEPSEQIWYNLSQPKKIGLPKPIQTLLRELT